MRTGTGCHFPPGMSPLSSLVSTRITKVGHAATVTNGGTPQQSMVECSDATWCAPVCDPCLLPTGCLLVHTAQGRPEERRASDGEWQGGVCRQAAGEHRLHGGGGGRRRSGFQGL